MKPKIAIATLLMVISTITVFAQNKELTVEEIIANNIKARGGYDKLKAVKSSRMTGKLFFGPEFSVPVTIEAVRPNKQRVDFTVQGMSGTQAYDGKQAWQVMPFGGGSKDPEPASADDQKSMQDDSDIDGPLVDWKDKGNKVEFIGKEDVQGSSTYKLKVTLKSGTIMFQFLDTDSFLEIHNEGKRMIRGAEVETTADIGDYKEVSGLIVPFSIESGPKNSPQRQKIVIEKIEVNVPVDEARFKMPEVKKEDKKAGDGKPVDAKPAEKKPPTQF